MKIKIALILAALTLGGCKGIDRLINGSSDNVQQQGQTEPKPTDQYGYGIN